MDFQNVHILFCDHDPSSGAATLSLLQRCSYKVTAVKGARQVVEALKSDNSDVDIVLTDVGLPQEKGFKMLKHILRQENLGHIAVVVMSEHDEMAVVAKCLHLGAVDYLVKPLRLNEIMNLWTHVWRKRRMMGLPDKNVGLTRMNLSANFQKPQMTADLLSGYKNAESPVATTADTWQSVHSKDDASPQLELSLRLSLNYSAEKLPERADFDPLPSHHSSPDGRAQPSAFSAYLKSCNVQPDEQSGTNACSASSSPSKRSRHSNECVTREDWKSAGEVQADTSLSSPKDTSVADETRPGDMESQICDRPDQLPVDQVPMQCIPTDKRIGGQACATNAQGFQPHYSFVGSHMQQGVRANVQEVTASGYSNPALNPSHVPQLPPFCHETGVANVPPVPNAYSYYPVTHLAVPVVNFSAWPAMIAPPPLAGGKLIQSERREAALSKFRMKRKGRCFEKKIRYASRKKLAEQRPRVRGQFVKRSTLLENIGAEAVSDEEGEADDEQGCSELDNSSPDLIAQRVG